MIQIFIKKKINLNEEINNLKEQISKQVHNLVDINSLENKLEKLKIEKNEKLSKENKNLKTKKRKSRKSL